MTFKSSHIDRDLNQRVYVYDVGAGRVEHFVNCPVCGRLLGMSDTAPSIGSLRIAWLDPYRGARGKQVCNEHLSDKRKEEITRRVQRVSTLANHLADRLLDYGYMDQVVQDCAGILLANETVVQDAADGKHGAMGYLRGQYMKFTKGKGNITRATELFNRVFEEHT